MQALQGDTKAISADSNEVHFQDTDDDCAQLQKSAAILFGFSGAPRLVEQFCALPHPPPRSAAPCTQGTGSSRSSVLCILQEQQRPDITNLCRCAGASMSPYIGLKLLFPELGTLLGYLALWFPDRSMAKFIQVLVIPLQSCRGAIVQLDTLTQGTLQWPCLVLSPLCNSAWHDQSIHALMAFTQTRHCMFQHLLDSCTCRRVML